MSVRRRIGLIVFGIALGLVALELALQTTAWLMWQSRQTQPAPADGVGGVLCLGDSFTFGLGAGDRDRNAWPRVLAGRLAAARGEPVRVVNAGLPGSDSAQVLARLGRQLDAWSPQLVYVLVGYNDFWSERPPVDEGEGFPLELRTLRLLRMIAAAFGGGPPGGGSAVGDHSDAPFVGAWHAGPTWIAFDPDGAVRAEGGETDLLWTRAGDAIVLTPLEGGDEMRLEWDLVDGRLELRGGPFPDPLRFAPGLPERHDLDRGRIAERAGRIDAALARYAAAAEVPELAIAAERARLRLASREGRDEVARAALARLAAVVDATADGDVDPALWLDVIDAGLEIGEREAAVGRTLRLLRRGPLDQRTLRFVTRRAFDLDAPELLDAAIVDALARVDLGDPERFALWGIRVELVPADLELATRALVEIARREPDADLLRGALRERPELAEAERLERITAEVVADPATRRRVLDAVERAAAADDHTADGLAGNLRRIVRRSRAAGAKVALLTYPIARPDVTRAVRTVAAELGCDVIDMFAAFRERVPAGERDALFIADGHCNDAGYRLMGEIVAEHAVGALR